MIQMDYTTEKTEKKYPHINRGILLWYANESRPLPWRQTKDPYHIWVSEIMLQQTQVDTVIPYYHRFVTLFPTVRDLAKAPLDAVLKAWENLGYYSRARHMHAAAKHMVAHYDGNVPDTRDQLLQLPGIGDYTADAILSIAFGLPFAAVDANIRRVISRLFAIETPLEKQNTKKAITTIANRLVPKQSSGDFNQGMMDLGATVCKPQNPDCSQCPVSRFCEAFAKGLQNTLPIVKKRAPIPHYHTTAGMMTDQRGRLLLVQRPNNGLLGGLWKLPGGKQRSQESLKECLRRTVKEELGLTIQAHKEIAKVNHVYTHFRVTLHAFQCSVHAGKPETVQCQTWKWSTFAELDKFALSKVDRKILKAIHKK